MRLQAFSAEGARSPTPVSQAIDRVAGRVHTNRLIQYRSEITCMVERDPKVREQILAGAGGQHPGIAARPEPVLTIRARSPVRPRTVS